MLNQPTEFAEKFINQTNQPLFLTGKAGTGKTTFLRKIVETTYKQTAIVAPTGIAALNAGGVTIHSFFQLPFAAFIPEFVDAIAYDEGVRFETKKSLLRHFKWNNSRKKVVQSLELLIIDEVSMLRADLLDAIDWTLRNVRKNNAPFGGVQVLFIGDLYQLPPVVKQQEWQQLQRHYSGVHFFHAKVMQERPPVYVELDKIFRQQNDSFIKVLNNLRNNRLTKQDAELLNSYVQKDFEPQKEEGYITLTTHNRIADEENQEALQKLNEKSRKFSAEITGDFPKHLYPLDPTLELKVGAQVMFVKNDLGFEKQFYNGKMAIVKKLGIEEIVVECIEDGMKVNVEPYEWENIKYTTSATTGEIEEETLGTFVQYPLKLAWAITVHKSQGLTFEKAVLDVSRVFAPGQAYVALSRLRSLDGLVLKQPISINGLETDRDIVNYSKQKEQMDQLPAYLKQSEKVFLYDYLMISFDWFTLVNAWQQHNATYKNAGSRSEKGKNATWSLTQLNRLEGVNENAKKFQGQIQRILNQTNPDLEHLYERVNAAYNFFFKELDEVYTSTMKQIVQLQKQRKTKQYAEELIELEDQLLKTIIQLKKAHRLIEVVANGNMLSKEMFDELKLDTIRVAKLAKIQHEIQQNRTDLFEQKETISIDIFNTSDQKKPAKKKKVATHLKTLEMIEEGLSIGQIAQQRQLTDKTIYKHIEKLIIDEKVDVIDFISPENIAALQRQVGTETDKSLGDMKEIVGNAFTWDELRLYRASLIV